MPGLKHPRRLAVIIFGLSFALLLAVFPWLSRPAPPLYAIVDLGVLPGDSLSEAYGLNNQGAVTGISGVFSGPSTSVHAFLYCDGKMTNIGSLGNPGNSVGHAINDIGEITGSSQPLSGRARQAYLYQDGKMRNLGAGAAVRMSQGMGLNHQGDVCGMTYPLGNSFLPQVFFCINGKATSLPTPTGCKSGIAQSINDQGQIVGRWYPGKPQAFLYDSRNRKMTLLAVPSPFTNSYAIKINNRGQIIGSAGLANGAAGYAQGPQRAVLWQNGKMTDMGMLPGSTGSAGLDINSRGEAVGYCFREFNAWETAWRRLVFRKADTRDWAFVWCQGRMMDLNELIPAQSGWVLEEARGINDGGQIVGSGRHDGQKRAFLLTPSH